MNANTNRLILAVLGGIAGISLAILLSPSSRTQRARLGKVAGDVGQTVREGLRARLRATPLMQTGQEMARLVSERAQAAAHRAQEAAHRAQEAAARFRRAGPGEAPGPGEAAASEALEEASAAALRALEAVEEVVKKTEKVLDRAKKKIDYR